MSLTGDPLTDALLPTALRIVHAVRREDDDSVAEATAEAFEVWRQQQPPHATAPYLALIVLLAAMVPEDEPATSLLGWRAEQEQVARYLEVGISREVAEAAVRAKSGR